MIRPGRSHDSTAYVTSRTHKSLKRPRSESASEHSFYNRESGQVYSEKIIKAPRRTRPWYDASLGTERPTLPKAATLRETALRTFLKNLHLLEVDSLQGIDWTPTRGQTLWKAIIARYLVSFRVWSIFMRRYFADRLTKNAELQIGDFELRVSDEHYELSTILTDMTRLRKGSPFLAFLTINDVALSPQTYLQLGELPNLAVLKLWETGRSDDPRGFNERVLRGWQAGAQGGVSFRALRALEVTDMGHATSAILAWFEHCRNLSLIRISPRQPGVQEFTVIGTWTKLNRRGKNPSEMQRLLSGKKCRPEELLKFALEASRHPPSTLPHATIEYGRNEDTRYYREEPGTSEVWVRVLNLDGTHPKQQVLTFEHKPTANKRIWKAGRDASPIELIFKPYTSS